MSTQASRPPNCPDATTLRLFLNDHLPESATVALAEHIEMCPACQQALDGLLGAPPGPINAITLGSSDEAAQNAPLPMGDPGPVPADSIPGYELLGEVGRGGMGVVYRARQKRPDRIVALKMLLAGRHAGPRERTRFLHEAEAVAQLQHPHIVPLYEAGQHGDLPYITLEYVSGGSLASLLKERPLLARDAGRLVEQLAEAMHYAHQRGIVHRDLKPGNVLLVTGTSGAEEPSESGGPGSEPSLTGLVPKVTDFGLAKNIGDASTLTSTGAVFGTPSYMAPEQASGDPKRIGAAADVYALGAILYECLTGRPPFHGPTPAETLLQVLSHEPAPPSVLQRSVPRDLETICLRCLRKEPARRYASARELAEDLRRFRSGEPILARPVGRLERAAKWCRRNPGVAGLSGAIVLLVLVAGGLVTWQWRHAVAALAEARREKVERARRQVAALPDAAPTRVPTILEELEANREEVLPLLRQLYHDEADRHRRMRLALALVPLDEALREPLTDWMLHAHDPAEVLLARDALAPFRGALTVPLWARAEDATAPEDVRFRALVALGAYDPTNPRWRKFGPQAAEWVLWANPLHQGLWVEALRPIGLDLLAPQAESSYFPLAVGTKRHYRRTAPDGETVQLEVRIDKVEILDGLPCARATTIVQGTAVASEHLRSTARGVFRHRFLGGDISPPFQLLRFPVVVGDSWQSEHREEGRAAWKASNRVGIEEVVVPAGRYEAAVVSVVMERPDAADLHITYWFAKGTGLVKQILRESPQHAFARIAATPVAWSGSPFGAGHALAATSLAFDKPWTITLELEKFEVAPVANRP